MTKYNNDNKLFEPRLVREALRQSFAKLNPTILYRNPVMFTVEIGTVVMLGVCLRIMAGEKSQGDLCHSLIYAIVREFC
jgi:K+-transporting ATPase ATPase B chain